MYTVFEVSASGDWCDTGSSYNFESYEEAVKFVDSELGAWACCTSVEGFLSLSEGEKMISFWCQCRHPYGYAEATYGKNYY